MLLNVTKGLTSKNIFCFSLIFFLYEVSGVLIHYIALQIGRLQEITFLDKMFILYLVSFYYFFRI